MARTSARALMSAQELYDFTLEFEKEILEAMGKPVVRAIKKRPVTPMRVTVGEEEYRLSMSPDEMRPFRRIGYLFTMCRWSGEVVVNGYQVTQVLRGYHVQAKLLPIPQADAPEYFAE